MPKHISSLQNPLIKNMVALSEKARERKSQGLFLVEGLREIKLAISAGYRPETLCYDPAFANHPELTTLLQMVPPDALTELSSPVFEKIAYRSGVANAVAICHTRPQTLHLLHLPPQPLILVLEHVEKPGNLGAILRTADAAGVDAVILCDPATDWYNPNVIRASLGAVFTVTVASATTPDTIQWLHEHHIRIAASYLEAAHPYYEENFRESTAIIMGAEATGISQAWIQAADQRIIIPMSGKVDSMNVSAATAILLFEARRQRTQLKP